MFAIPCDLTLRALLRAGALWGTLERSGSISPLAEPGVYFI